jgi:hypothetical protein
VVRVGPPARAAGPPPVRSTVSTLGGSARSPCGRGAESGFRAWPRPPPGATREREYGRSGRLFSVGAGPYTSFSPSARGPVA